MPRVEVWKCERTGKIFETTKRYRKHLRKEVVIRRSERILAKATAEFNAQRDALWKGATSFEEIARFIEENPGLLFSQFSDWYKFDRNGRALPVPTFANVCFERMQWNDHCSNTHAAPTGRPTNWGRKPNLPHGYPGWRGLFSYETLNHSISIDSQAFVRLGIHTGSGGGGPTRYRYDVTVFAEEFTGMAFMNALMRPPK